MHLTKLWRIWAVLALASTVALAGCEGTTGDETGDAVSTDTMTNGDAAGMTDSGGTPAATYRYVLISEGNNVSITECKAGDDTPGADIDAVGLYRGGTAEAYCDSITWRTGTTRGTAFCDGKDPVAANADAAKGAPDACTADFATPECPVLESDKWIWLNGGEIVCDLGKDASIVKDDQIVVYEVFNPAKADSEESYFVKVADNPDGPWTDLGEGKGIAPVTVPAL